MKNTITNVSLMIILAFAFTACSTSSKEGAEISNRMDSSSYESLIQKNTRHDLQYEGFYNKFEVFATYLNTETQAAILQKMSDALLWNTKQAQTEREKMFQENSTQTKFAISFYVPSTRLNDLNKSTSGWKIYLDSGGERYEGKVTKRNGKLENIMAVYPYHNRWAVAYDVVFSVPLSGTESQASTLVITSTIGTAKLQF